MWKSFVLLPVHWHELKVELKVGFPPGRSTRASAGAARSALRYGGGKWKVLDQ